MTNKLLATTLLGAATVAAAAGGGYVALRRNAVDRPAISVQSAPAVEATESLVPPEPPTAEPSLVSRQEELIRPVERRSAAAPRRQETRPAPQQKAPEPVATPAPAPAAPAPTPAPVMEPAAPEMRYEPTSVAAAEPRRPQAEELTVTRDAVIGIRLESNISSETAKVEDKVVARVARDVMVDGRTAISSGARLDGVVASVERGGKFKDRARIGVRFNSLVLADGTRLPIETETIFREGDSPTRQAATKVGAGAAIGGVLGAVLGGKKGAAIGSTVGAAGGTAAVVTGAPADVVLPAGTPLTVRLTEPITVMIQREE